MVDTDPGAVRKAISDPGFTSTYGELSGERLKRLPRGFAKDHPDAFTCKDYREAFAKHADKFDAVIVSLLTSDSFIYRKPVEE